jgi:tetratricopeptide (TPR) repeat protein
VGWYQALLGNHAQALPYCEQALTLLRQLGDCHGEANTWDSLGYIHLHLGHSANATECFSRALALFRGLHDRYNEAQTLANLADADRAVGDIAAARAHLQDALGVLVALDHADVAAISARLQALS